MYELIPIEFKIIIYLYFETILTFTHIFRFN